MMQGWIKIHRQLMDSSVWAKPELLRLWLMILMKVNHQPKEWIANGKAMTIPRGAMVTGRAALEREYAKNWCQRSCGDAPNGRTLARWLDALEVSGMLSLTKSKSYTVIHVVKYDEYQADVQVGVQHDVQVGVQAVSKLCPSSVQALSTNKNDKNDKKERKRDHPPGGEGLLVGQEVDRGIAWTGSSFSVHGVNVPAAYQGAENERAPLFAIRSWCQHLMDQQCFSTAKVEADLRDAIGRGADAKQLCDDIQYTLSRGGKRRIYHERFEESGS